MASHNNFVQTCLGLVQSVSTRHESLNLAYYTLSARTRALYGIAGPSFSSVVISSGPRAIAA